MNAKYFLILALLLITPSLLAVTTYYSIRSQAVNAARELAGTGWATQINSCEPDPDNDYGNFAVTAEYTRSFRSNHIGKCLFGCCTSCAYPCGSCCGSSSCSSCGPCCNSCRNDDCTIIKISGSQVENRGACDWLADHFGLPTDYQSCVTFEPRISNFIVDFNIYIGFDCCPALYFRLHLPVVHTKWNLNMCECIQDRGTNNHWVGYFNPSITEIGDELYGILRSNLISNFTSFITGCGTINDPSITFEQLRFARMCPCEMTETRFAELTAVAGWNFWCDEDYHFGINIRTAAPAGNRPRARYLFEPMVGNGKHWELGGGLTGHWTFWRNEEEEKYCSLYIDANVTHLFRTQQCRTFDLRCNPLSRYMLAAKFGRPVENLRAGDNPPGVQPIKQFKGIYTPVANLTTFPVNVSADIQADIAVKFQYVKGNWGCDLGYNLWTRSCEKIDFDCGCGCPFEENTWALKGDNFMYGFVVNGVPQIPGVALSASQSGATICRGTNNYPDGIREWDGAGYVTIPWFANPGTDRRKRAWDAQGNDLLTFSPDLEEINQVYTSLNPQFISFCEMDCDSTRTRALSHKFFGSIDYTWREHERSIPYLGVGFEIEFAHHTFDKGCDQCYYPCGLTEYSCGNCCYPCDRCCDDTCCCQYCAVSQWGIWVKGGLAF